MDRKTLENKMNVDGKNPNSAAKDTKPSPGSSYTTNLRK